MTTDYDCPDCGGPMKLRVSRFGAFYGCLAYPNCTGTRREDGTAKGVIRARPAPRPAPRQQEPTAPDLEVEDTTARVAEPEAQPTPGRNENGIELPGPEPIDPSTLPPRTLVLDAHQQAVVDWRSGSALVAAGAGSGKSTVLVERCAALLADGVMPEHVVTLVFNSAAGKTLQARLAERLGADVGARMVARTFHGWAYGVLKGWEPRNPSYQKGRIIGTDDGPNGYQIGMRAAKTVGVTGDLSAYLTASGQIREALIDLDDEDAIELVSNLRISGRSEAVATRLVAFARQYQKEKGKAQAIDFADMLYIVGREIEKGTTRAKKLAGLYQHVQVDEGQDINVVRMTISRHLASMAESFVVVGDARQCQPAGTKVLVPGGEKNIEELRDGDVVRAWDRSSIYVQQKTGSKVKVACRPYIGALTKVEAEPDLAAGEKAPFTTETTDTHRWLVRWSPKARDLHAVYVMRKTINGRACFRIGWCKIIDESNGVMNQHFKQRARLEGANAIWLVRVCQDRAEASAWESIFSVLYGIPTVMFKPAAEATLYNEKTLQLIWDECGSRSANGAETLLVHLDLRLDHPLWSSGGHPGRKTLFETVAANLCEGMQVPVWDGARGYTWRDAKITRRHVHNLPVYSLDVEKHHAYIADGICTLNSIYGFTGARPDLFKGLLDDGATLMTLPVNRRSTAAVVNAGNVVARGRDWNLGGECSPHDAAAAGEPLRLWSEVGSDASEGAMVAAEIMARVKEGLTLVDKQGRANYSCLVRTNAGAAGLEAALLTRGLPVRVLGTSGGVWTTTMGREVIAYLAAASGEPNDDVTKIANKPVRFLKNDDVKQALEAAHRGMKFTDALRAIARERMPYRTEWHGAWGLAENLDVLSGASWAEQCKAVGQFLKMDLTNRAKDDEAADVIAAQVKPDEDKAAMYEALCRAAQDLGSLEAINEQIKTVKKHEGEPAVEISTIHKSKGAEWTMVFVCNVTEGILPHMKTEDEEEERRLFYVALTRAKQSCIVSGGAEPSSFFIELQAALPPPPPLDHAALVEKVEEQIVQEEDAMPEVTGESPADAGEPVGAVRPTVPPTLSARLFIARARLLVDLPEAEALGESTAPTYATAAGPGSRYVEILRSDMEALLGPHGFVGATRDVTKNAGQQVLELGLPSDRYPDSYVVIRVYTTIPLGSVTSRGLGEDSIKVAALRIGIDGKAKPLHQKLPYACRTRGWRVTLLGKIAEVLDIIESKDAIKVTP